MTTTTSIDELQTQVDQVGTDLTSLKTETDEAIRKTKVQEIELDAKAAKDTIQKELGVLKWMWSTNLTIQENITKLETMLTTLETSTTDLSDLKMQIQSNTTSAVDNPTVTPDITTPIAATTTTQPIKPVVDRNWIQRQRDGATSKEEWKTNTLTNIARVAWGIWAAALAWKWFKWLFGIGKDKDKKSDSWDDDYKVETKEETEKSWSHWRKWLIGWWLLTAWGYGLYRLLKWEWLSFEDSIIQAEADLWTISESDEINHGRWRITYEESVKQIKSYGVWTKIDKWKSWFAWLFSSKKIDWLDLKFADYKQLIHAANLINYIKHKYKGRCETDTPFYTKSLTWDIYIKIKDGNNDVEEEEIISGGVWSTLSSICPDMLNGIFTETTNKDKFLAYLNKQAIWKEGNVVAPDPKWDKIQKTMNDVFQEIVDTPSEFDPLWNERWQIITDPDNADKTEYTVQSRWTPAQETKVKMEADTDGTITSWKIDGLEIKFTTVKELLRTANLVNKLKYQYAVATPLMLGPTDKAFYRTSSYGLVWWSPWIYVDSSTTRTVDTRVVKKDTLESLFPVVLTNKDVFIVYLNALKDAEGKGLWEK